MKIALYLVGAAFALFLVVVKFSAVETIYACKGTVTEADDKNKGEAYIRLSEYRFWVALWNKSDGDLWVEVPGRTVGWFSHLKKSGDIYAISESSNNGFAGDFSSLSRSLSLRVSGNLFFEGSCSLR